MAIPAPEGAAELKRKALLWLERLDTRGDSSEGAARKGKTERRMEEGGRTQASRR